MISLVKFFRINDWVKNLGIILISSFLVLDIRNFVFSLIISILSLSSAFSFNNLMDYKFMKENNYIKKIIRKNNFNFLVTLSILPAFLSIFISLFYSVFAFFLTLFFNLLMLAYSSPPLRLKRHWIFSLLINSISLSVFLFLLSLNYFPVNAFYWCLIFVFFIYILVSEILHQICHFKVDKRSNIFSFPVSFGIKNSINLIKYILVFELVFVLLFIFKFRYWIFLSSIPFIFLRLEKIKYHKNNFCKLRNEFFGLYEGILYLLVLLKNII